MSRTVITNMCFVNRDKRTILDVIDLTKSTNHIFDLNSIKPMPSSLKNFLVDTISYQQFALRMYENGNKSLLLSLSEVGVTLEQTIDKISKKRPHENLGQKMYDNYNNHGFPTWREFCQKEWGIGNNHNFISQMFDVNTISLTTPNQYPKPIIKQLSLMFPTDLIHVKYACDTPGEYVKSFKILNGVIVETINVKDKRIIYCELFKKSKSIFPDLLRNGTLKNIIYD